MKKQLSPETRENYKKIMRRISRMQNGDVAKILRKMGIAYRLNYGVSIPHLRQLVTDFKPNNELAYLLWEKNIRETKILASVLFETDKISMDEAVEITKKVTNQELIEQYSRNFFSRLLYLPQLFEKWVKGTETEIILAYYSAGWYIRQGGTQLEEIKKLALSHIVSLAQNDSSLIHQSLSFVLQSLSVISASDNQEIKELAERLMHSEKSTARRLGEEFLWFNTK